MSKKFTTNDDYLYILHKYSGVFSLKLVVNMTYYIFNQKNLS